MRICVRRCSMSVRQAPFYKRTRVNDNGGKHLGLHVQVYLIECWLARAGTRSKRLVSFHQIRSKLYETRAIHILHGVHFNILLEDDYRFIVRFLRSDARWIPRYVKYIRRVPAR
jgi:hypothetical protein